MTKREQNKELQEIKRNLSKLGLKRKMRVSQEVEYKNAILEIADIDGEYSENGYIVTHEGEFLYGEFSPVFGVSNDDYKSIINHISKES
jgi:hypothetical protein